jgi:hypothetical protein
VAGADAAIIVTTPENAAVRDADRVIGLLEQHRIPARLIINRIRANMVKSGEMLDVDEIVQVLAVDLLGIVPDDEKVIKAANSGEPTVMDPSSRAAIAYRNIARRVLGEKVPLMQLDDKNKLKRIDLGIMLILGLLMVISVLVVRSATYGNPMYPNYDLKQLIFFLAGFAVAVFATLFDYRFFLKYWYVLYGFGVLLLVLVYFFGVEINGARSWFKLADGLLFRPNS